ncbi:MAG: hypothetical protein EP326_05910 [Deltaproteobacteria bacterium]|nr:MAG: hypothetical protein EP326_05910 [Deltaproteobacteria bacterium]TNF27542.1 MAG: hypothetical protein EP319_11490 [Deltaproteobacteria bacterium]
MRTELEIRKPGDFEPENHFYPKALNSQIHPLISFFFNLSHKQLISRYVHLNPTVDEKSLKDLLEYKSKHFFWGGADLFYVTTEKGNRKMVVLETNSCPSGQKSMPALTDSDEFRGYKSLVENSFIPAMKGRRLPEGKLAVIFDKNYLEASGYASTIAELTGEEVYLIPYYTNFQDYAYFEDGILFVKDPAKGAVPIRAALRYVTQKPWNRIPVQTKTLIYNSTLVCLSGGRNKLVASKAYDLFNSEIHESGLKIITPETIRDVSKLEIPLWVKKFGGYAVIKNPYSNAGQGVYTVTSQKELDDFMSRDYPYDQFIVQSLIGHYNWTSNSATGHFYHIGTVPNKKGHSYVADLRMMVVSTPQGFKPVALYARKAASPLEDHLEKGEDSWSILGTNLSVKKGENDWDSDTSRLMLLDRKDFNTLGLGVDDLIEAFIQATLSIIAIDKMCVGLINQKGKFRKKLFSSLDNDDSLMSEIMI